MRISDASHATIFIVNDLYPASAINVINTGRRGLMSMLFITYHYYFLFAEEAEQPRKRIPFELIKMIRVVIKCNPAGIYLANFDQTFKVNCLLL